MAQEEASEYWKVHWQSMPLTSLNQNAEHWPPLRIQSIIRMEAQLPRENAQGSVLFTNSSAENLDQFQPNFIFTCLCKQLWSGMDKR